MRVRGYICALPITSRVGYTTHRYKKCIHTLPTCVRYPWVKLLSLDPLAIKAISMAQLKSISPYLLCPPHIHFVWLSLISSLSTLTIRRATKVEDDEGVDALHRLAQA
jgi:hypothetical protein